MKHIIQISLGPSIDDNEFETDFLKQKFSVQRLGTDGDVEKASDLLLKWNKKADAIALGGIRSAQSMGQTSAFKNDVARLLAIGSKLVVAPEDKLRRMVIRSNRAKLELWDGRTNHNNGWFIVRSKVPVNATKGAIEAMNKVRFDYQATDKMKFGVAALYMLTAEDIEGAGALYKIRLHLFRRVVMVVGLGKAKNLLVTEFILN